MQLIIYMDTELIETINYKKLLSGASFGYAYNKLILDEKGKPADYEIIELNRSFENLTGLKRNNILGRRITAAVPEIIDDPFDWIGFYGDSVINKKCTVFDYYSKLLGRWYSVHVTPQDNLCFVTMFFDITELKDTENKLRDRTESLDRRISGMDLIIHLSILVQKKGITPAEVFSDAVKKIPGAFFYPGQISAAIKYREEIYQTDPFLESVHKLSEKLIVHEEHCGFIEVYLNDGSQALSPERFIQEERELIGILARYLEQFAEKVESDWSLQRSHTKLRQYLNFAPDGIFIVNRKGRYIEVNPAACSLLGYTEDELLSMSIPDILPPEGKEKGIAAFVNLIEKGNNSMEITLLKKDGSRVCVALESVELPDGTFMGFCKDISDRKKSQNELLQSVIFNQALINTIPTPIYYKDKSGKYLGMNNAFAEFFGKTKEELTGRRVNEIMPGELAEIYRKMDSDLFRNSGIQVFEAPLKDYGDNLHDMIFHKATFNDVNGNPEGLIGVIIDITERKKAERELELYFKAIQSINQPLLITDSSGSIIRANNSFIRMYGYSLEELAGNNPRILNPGKDVYINFGYTEEDYNRLFSSMWNSIPNPDCGTWEDIVINRKKDGSLVWVNLLINAVYNNDREPVNYIALPVDISGSIQREKMSKIQLYQTIAALAELRDNETGNHMRRVGIFAKLLAQEYKMPEQYCSDIEIFAPLHDIGKVGILDSLLLAERKLTPEEFEVMKTHTTLGYNIVKGNKELEMVAAITSGHHEWYDGSGYPAKLTGENIPLSARITAVADVYDALRSKRPYKKEWNHMDAKKYIIKGAGTQFDPEFALIFSQINDRFEKIYNDLKDSI